LFAGPKDQQDDIEPENSLFKDRTSPAEMIPLQGPYHTGFVCVSLAKPFTVMFPPPYLQTQTQKQPLQNLLELAASAAQQRASVDSEARVKPIESLFYDEIFHGNERHHAHYALVPSDPWRHAKTIVKAVFFFFFKWNIMFMYVCHLFVFSS
jgi:hypothetical protein